jgi:molecular chaperone GrpE (heat shock protein)
VLRWFRSLTARSLPPAPPERPDWADELLEAVLEAMQKQARAAAKQGARFEVALGALEERVTSVAARLEQRVAPVPVASAPIPEAVFDALDGLDVARALADDPHLAEGLSRVADRLERWCASQGYRRLSGLGAAPNARLMRVAGTEPRRDLAPGLVSRVVKAAIVRGEELVREGSVIVSSEELVREASLIFSSEELVREGSVVVSSVEEDGDEQRLGN